MTKIRIPPRYWRSQPVRSRKALSHSRRSEAETAASVSAGSTDSSQEAAVSALPDQAPAHASQAVYTVKFGDTLADICNRYYGSTDRLQELCDLNGIMNPQRDFARAKVGPSIDSGKSLCYTEKASGYAVFCEKEVNLRKSVEDE